jgi:hypothetical protein
MSQDGEIDHHSSVFCVLDRLRDALRRRDIFVNPSWRDTDPRSGLLASAEWEAARPIVCRSLGYTADPEPVLAALAEELDQTYRRVAARLPQNPAVTIERVANKDELVLSPLDQIDEPPSLLALRDEVTARMPRADLPEIMLEIAARTGFTEAFTHINDGNARAEDIGISFCAALMGEATNTGPEPLVRKDIPALRRDRLSWVAQNYLRDETITAANAIAEFGRIEKTLHLRTTIDDETKRRGTLIQLNRHESRHSLARDVFHGKRGELRQRYREGQEDQLGALGLVVNIIVLWNTIYVDAVIKQLRKEGYPVKDEDMARLAPMIRGHINVVERHSFVMPESVARGELRPLRDRFHDDA